MDLTDNQPVSSGPALHLNKSLALGPSQDGNELGYIEFDGTDTTSTLQRAAYIISHQQGSSGNGFVPGTLEFFTTTDGTHIDQQRMIINSSGEIGINIPTPYKQLQVSTVTQDALNGIASNSADVNTIIGAYSQGSFTGLNVGSIQVTNSDDSTAPYTLALNPRGGDIYIGSSIASTFINGGTTISTLTVNTINGQIYDPTQDTHWTGYDAGSGIVNVYNENNGAIGIGTGATIATNVQFQVNGNSLFNGQISTSNLTTPYVSSVNNSLIIGGEVYISSSSGDDFAQLHLFNSKAKITTNAPYDGMYLEVSGNNPIILASTLGGINDNIYATFGPTSTIINGIVGIGTNTPAYKLDVAGNIYASTNLTTPSVSTSIINMSSIGASNGQIIGLSTINGIAWPPIDDALWSQSGNDIYNDNTGNVGIGTINPQYKLDVAGNIYASTNLTAPSVSTSIINMSSIGASNGQIIGLSTINGIAWPPLDDAFWSKNGNNIYNDNIGYVGINNSSPQYTLDVSGTTNTTNLIIDNNATIGGNTTIGYPDNYQSPYELDVLGTTYISSVGSSNVIYNTPGTFTTKIPVGVTIINFEMVGAGGPSADHGASGTGGYIQGAINVTGYQGQTISIVVGNVGNINPETPSGASYIYIPTSGPLFVMTGAGGTDSFAGAPQYGGWGGGGPFTLISPNNYVAIGGDGETSGDSSGAQGGQLTGGGLGGICTDITGASGNGRPGVENYQQALGGIGNDMPPGGSGYTGGGEGCGSGGGSSYYNSLYTVITTSFPGNTLPVGTLPGYGRNGQSGYVSIIFVNNTALITQGNIECNGNLIISGTSISRVSTVYATSGTTLDNTYWGKYVFANSTDIAAYTLILGGGALDGTVVVIRNAAATTNSISVTNVQSGPATILPTKTTSYIYTNTSPLTAGWYAL